MIPTTTRFASADGSSIAYISLGTGPSVVLVGGVLSIASDYLPLARGLAPHFQVHILERRGRPNSSPQPPDYSLETERADLSALLDRTGASRVFGHSYGGLIALETAARQGDLSHVAVYEPGIPSQGALRLGWLGPYEQCLAQGDRRAAFAHMVRGSGHAPAALNRVPFGMARLILRSAIPKRRWQHMEPLLETNLREHDQLVAWAQAPTDFRHLTPQLLVLIGERSPSFSTVAHRQLASDLSGAQLQALAKLGHDGPEKAPAEVALVLRDFFESPPPGV